MADTLRPSASAKSPRHCFQIGKYAVCATAFAARQGAGSSSRRFTRGVRLQVFPHARTFLTNIVQTGLSAFLYEAFPLAIFRHDDQFHVRIYLTLTVPVATGCTNFDLGRQYDFLRHYVLDG